MIVCGSVSGAVSILKLPTLLAVRTFDLSDHGSILSFCYTPGERFYLLIS